MDMLKLTIKQKKLIIQIPPLYQDSITLKKQALLNSNQVRVKQKLKLKFYQEKIY